MTKHPDRHAFAAARTLPIDQALQHYSLSYHGGIVNHCPGCAGTHWLVGRMTAQCARCETALPLAQIAESATRPLFVSRVSSTACH